MSDAVFYVMLVVSLSTAIGVWWSYLILSRLMKEDEEAMNDLETLAPVGDPKKIVRRAKNKFLGRLLAKLKIWR